jgi:hypothetical protein
MKEKVFCRKCGQYLGAVKDKQSFSVGNIVAWDCFRISCLCGRPYTFRPRLPEDELDEKRETIALETLNELGKIYNCPRRRSSTENITDGGKA